MDDLDTFTDAYVTCALWSTNDESDEHGGDPLDQNYALDDIAPEALASIVADCAKFQADNADALRARPDGLTRGGHDFWLTRNRHGAGFWDGDWPEPQATQLDRAAKAFGECYLYVGDDGRIYL